jgi:hypothetical protein
MLPVKICMSAMPFFILACMGSGPRAWARDPGSCLEVCAAHSVIVAVLPNAPTPQTAETQNQPGAPDHAGQAGQGQQTAASPEQQPQATAKRKPPPQPKRILGIMPNYRAVSAGEIPPPPTPREAFMVASRNSFDYSAFIFVGITSLLAEGTNAHSQLGKGIPGFWGYYWRGYLDKTDGNYLVDWAMPSVFHQDERYYAMWTRRILPSIALSTNARL